MGGGDGRSGIRGSKDSNSGKYGYDDDSDDEGLPFGDEKESGEGATLQNSEHSNPSHWAKID